MRKRSDEQLETPITSLIDVVFQLIIFFVVAAAQQKDLIDTEVNLAQAKHVREVQKQDPATVFVNLRKDGTINIALQPLTVQQLQQVLVATVAQAGNAVPVVIRCDASVLYHEIDKVMQAVGKAGLYRVKLSAVVTK